MMTSESNFARSKPSLPYRNLVPAAEQQSDANMGTLNPIVLATANALSVVSQPKILKEFELFPRLPIEIRHEIYALASSVPRVVEIRYYFGKSKSKSSNKQELRMRSNALVPAIMHACVDSRNAGKKIYKPLIFDKFIGTYIRWSTDYVMFKEDAEDVYMTYEGKVPAGFPNFDLVMKVERLAVKHAHINEFVRIQADPENVISTHCQGSVLVYPSLKEVAIVEIWPGYERMTENLSIQPKQYIPKRLPSSFCPSSPNRISPDGMRIVQNRWHQECNWMRIIPGKFKLVSRNQKTKPAESHTQPKAPKKLSGISRFSALELQRLCRARGLDGQGNRKDLIARLSADDVTLQQRYRTDLHEWANIMLGYTDPVDGEELSLEVKAARSEALAKWLTEKGLA